MLASATACGGGGKSGDKGDSASSQPGGAAAGSGAGKGFGGNGKKTGGAAHAVVLQVEGKGEVPGIYYNAESNGNATNVKLPWKKAAKVPGGFQVAVLASAGVQKKVGCSITVDGTVVVKKSGAVAQCRYKLKK